MDAIPLTRALLHFDTVNPPGREADCARHAGKLLQDWGYAVEYHEFAPGRTSVRMMLKTQSAYQECTSS